MQLGSHPQTAKGSMVDSEPSISGRGTGPLNLWRALQKRTEGWAGEEAPRNLVAFWLLGLLNNSAYVMMIAGANDISSGAVGLVFFCNIFPCVVVKFSAPYWFHLVSYRVRMVSTAVLMTVAYLIVALSSGMGGQLFGVVLSSIQGGLGEASCLAMAALYDGRRMITAWSSGTGFAGVFGFSWVAILHYIVGFSFTTTLLLANFTTAVWLLTFHLLLQAPMKKKRKTDDVLILHESHPPRTLHGSRRGSFSGLSPIPEEPSAASTGEEASLLPAEKAALAVNGDCDRDLESRLPATVAAAHPSAMTWRERTRRIAALWPYMVPLIIVYCAEYAMQSGTWTAIGFPVTDTDARHTFYEAANWCYQLGVFLSRSSGMLFQANRTVLWAMPAIQVVLLALFTADAAFHVWYNWGLLLPAFGVGLLGGAVYVNAFTLINLEIEPGLREFSLAAASLADSLGIALADIAGILIQGCLFRVNKLPGASYQCS